MVTTIQTPNGALPVQNPSQGTVVRMGALEPIQLLILQPTPFCNINCSYCYLPGRDATGRMSHDVVARIADEVLTSEVFGPDSLILFHAGEPCVVPISWYERTYEILQSRVRHPLRFQFQTNGTLIDEDWARFFARTGTGITLSIDGPAGLHDSHRVDRQATALLESARAIVGSERWHGLISRAVQSVMRWTPDGAGSFAGVGLCVHPLGLPTVTYDEPRQGLIGLHVDSWYGDLPPQILPAAFR
jgi:Radical SAM superfamily